MKIKKIAVLFFCMIMFHSFVGAEIANTDNKAFDIANGYYISGCQKLEKMDFEGAMSDFDKSIRNMPSPQAYLNRGFIKDEMGDYEGAIKDYTLSIEAAGDNDEFQAEGYYNRALANESLQRYNASLSDYASAIDLNPKNADYYAQRAILKSKLQGYQSGAIADIEKAISLEPTHAGYKQIKTEISKIVSGVQPATKQQSFAPQEQQPVTVNKNSGSMVSNDLKQNTPAVATNLATLAKENMQKQNYGLAIDYFGRAIEDKPFSSQNAELYYLRGECYKNLGNIRAARKDYDQAILLDQNIRLKKNYLRN